MKCPVHCPCICHDGYGGAHPGQRCPGKGGPQNEWTIVMEAGVVPR